MIFKKGMNVLAAPFLYVMSELEAFFCFKRFIMHVCPMYVINDGMKGVLAGCRVSQYNARFIKKYS